MWLFSLFFWLFRWFKIIFKVKEIGGFMAGIFLKDRKKQEGSLLVPAGSGSVTILLDFAPTVVEASLVEVTDEPQGYPACQPVLGDSAVASIVEYGHKHHKWGISISWEVAGPRQLSWMAKNHAG